MEQIDYTVGDEIVCVKTHSMKIVKEGDLKTCLGLTISPCKCKDIVVNVGINHECPVSIYPTLRCEKCGMCYKNDSIWWIYASYFKKLDNLVNINSLLEEVFDEVFTV